MKIIIMTILSLAVISGFGKCYPDNKKPDLNSNKSDKYRIKIIIGTETFTATLENSPTTEAFIQLLPITINMDETNGNEKYYRLSKSLPVRSGNPQTIRNGDIMLWGSNTLVIFYKSFSTSYSYTRLGKIDNPSGLQSSLGSGSVNVTFEPLQT